MPLIYFAISGFLNFIISLVLGVFILTKDIKSQINRTLSYFCFSVAVWSFFYIFWPTEQNKEYALLWFQLLHIGAVFTSVTAAHFTIVWLGKYEKMRKIIIFGYITAILFVPTMFTSLFIRDMVPKMFFHFWGVPGILYHFYLLHFFGYWLFVPILMLKELKYITSDIKRTQARLVLTGLIIAVIGGSTNYFLFYNIPIPAVANILVLVYPSTVVYTILRYRLMNIRFVMGRIAIYIFSFLSVITIGISLIFLNSQLGNPVPIHAAWLSIFIMGILLFLYFFRFFEKMAGRYFYYTFYTLQTTIANLSKKLNQIIALEKLTTFINRSLLDALKLDRVGIVLREPKKKVLKPQQLIKFEKEDISSILTIEDKFLAQYLQKTKKPLVREEIPFLIEKIEKERKLPEKTLKEEKRKLNLLKQELDKMGIGLLLPLFIKEELIGIIVLGEKLSKTAYTVQDLNLLSTLTAQAAVAFSNALSYEEIERRKADLEHFYDLTVGRELKMIELKKEIKKLEERIRGKE